MPTWWKGKGRSSKSKSTAVAGAASVILAAARPGRIRM
jgi:hypothetical protein